MWGCVKGAKLRQVAQELARHSSPMFTLGRHAHVQLLGQTRALDALPVIKAPRANVFGGPGGHRNVGHRPGLPIAEFPRLFLPMTHDSFFPIRVPKCNIFPGPLFGEWVMTGNDVTIAWTSPGDNAYRSLVDDCAQSIRQRHPVPLFGAGISLDKPACLPLANDLVEPLLKTLNKARSLVQTILQLDDAQVHRVDAALRRTRLERLLDAFHQAYGQEAMEYLSVLRGSFWNFNHATVPPR